MKKKLSDQVMNLWKKEYSSYLKKYTKYEPTEQFHHIAKLCAPGKSYYYILNLSNLSLDYVDPNIETVIGVRQDMATIDSLLKIALPNELELILKKEKIIFEFISTFVNQRDLLSYKIVYTYKCKGLKGQIQTMMIQTTALELSEMGKIEHAFVIHSDISHLRNITTDWVSFISLNGKKSYLNIKVEHACFDPNLANTGESSCNADLSKRELEIVKLMSQGLSAKIISEKLFISFNTTRTHRKNILRKTNCSNTAELITKCWADGAI